MSDVQSDKPPALAQRRNPVQARSGRPTKQRARYANGPSPKVKRAIEIMVWGGDDGLPLPRKQAAKAAGLADVTLRTALAQPLTIKHFNQQLDVLRTGERPRSIAKIAQLRDTAKSERTQLDAAKYLDGGDKGSGITVNVGIQNLQPGYAIAVPQDYADGARQMLKLSGSHANVLDLQADVPTDEPGTR